MAEITDIQLANLQEVQSTRQNDLLANPNVVGVGIARKISKGVDTGEHCLSVFVSQKLPPELLPKDALVPRSLDKVKTDVIETGVIFAGDAQGGGAGIAAVAGIEALTARVRPAMGGYSVGHFRITAGTYSTAVYDATAFPGIPRRYYILSNNHVLANSNDAQIGDAILQPGPYDGGVVGRDTIAHLSRFVPIRFDGLPNYVDCALAEGDFQSLDREIYWIGYPRTPAIAAIGMLVQKTGRTTNYTTGRVTAINATVNVNYGGSKVARFERQILTTNMSAGGDSGSLVLDLENRPIGLLFAGSSVVTILNDIRYVQQLLGIRIA
jgi:hypothetical protein